MITPTTGRAPRLAGVVLTYNEQENLPACLASLRDLVAPLLVVDSGSDDRTVDIARAAGAAIFQHPFTSHAEQWQWALAQLPAEVEWVLAIDADQFLTAALRAEISVLFNGTTANLNDFSGFYVKRRQMFRGRWISHGGYYPKYLMKLFRVADVIFDERDLMDHHFYVRGRVGKLTADLVENNKKETDISFWIRKHVHYAELHAREELMRRSGTRRWVIQPDLFGTPDQRVLWFKERWYRMPLYVRPFLYFIFRYVVQMGFLDGKEGFLFHFLQAFWYRLLVDIQLESLHGQQQTARASMLAGVRGGTQEARKPFNYRHSPGT